MAGKKGLIVGIANQHSIAYGCAQVLDELERLARLAPLHQPRNLGPIRAVARRQSGDRRVRVPHRL